MSFLVKLFGGYSKNEYNKLQDKIKELEEQVATLQARIKELENPQSKITLIPSDGVTYKINDKEASGTVEVPKNSKVTIAAYRDNKLVDNLFIEEVN